MTATKQCPICGIPFGSAHENNVYHLLNRHSNLSLAEKLLE